ncbi:Hypothetical protein PACV_22 [Pacmanvirus A23]|uniref:Hypothetical protein n=1 Tax=Pacmanvirus A23 TaxID=1932881 RepID=UPI000A092210|nr:Hypothetical protein B9W72_gp022 [Pacmanvirus A23]SIP85739.1 Hypothetical protein PACV_22 [Pacmanvirus A23]
MSSIKVYRITTYDTYGNAFACNRHETWSIKLDKTFADESEATKYVVSQNSKLSQFKNLAIGLSDEDYENFINEFTLSGKYLDECRWFVGYPPVDKISELLHKKGIDTD